MTRKQQLFCDYYLVDLNATKAAIKAGYSKKTAMKIGSENLHKLEIKQYIDKRMAEKQGKAIASQDEILQILTNIARSKISKESDKIRATELIGKYYNVWHGDKTDFKAKVTIINDIPKKP
jgi:phage terminase small subunit